MERWGTDDFVLYIACQFMVYGVLGVCGSAVPPLFSGGRGYMSRERYGIWHVVAFSALCTAWLWEDAAGGALAILAFAPASWVSLSKIMNSHPLDIRRQAFWFGAQFVFGFALAASWCVVKSSCASRLPFCLFVEPPRVVRAFFLPSPAQHQ